MAGARLGPGHIQDFDRVPSYIGEWSGGLTDRAGRIAAAFTAAGLETNASTDIRTEIWKKLLGNMNNERRFRYHQSDQHGNSAD